MSRHEGDASPFGNYDAVWSVLVVSHAADGKKANQEDYDIACPKIQQSPASNQIVSAE